MFAGKVTGTFTKLFDSLVYGVNTGDISVFQDDDGKAYYLYELWDNGKTSQGFSIITPGDAGNKSWAAYGRHCR